MTLSTSTPSYPPHLPPNPGDYKPTRQEDDEDEEDIDNDNRIFQELGGTAGARRVSDTSDQNASFSSYFSKKAFFTLIYVAGWYTSSLSLSVYNKWLFSKDHHNFPYPLFTTMFHNIMLFLLSFLSLHYIVPHLKPTRYPSTYDYFTKVFPCGLATGLDIGLSNSSLKSITLTFYTMVKSGAPVFVLLFAFLFKLEKPSIPLVGVILIICIGVLLMVMDKTNFNLTGYMEVQIATVLSGLRWSLTQILLDKEDMGMNNPLATNLFLSPLMAISLFFASLASEGIHDLSSSPFFESFHSALSILTVIAFGGVIAFFMMTLEFQLISYTSVVTFSIAGIVKEILTIGVSHLIFNDRFTGTAPWGLAISLIGICGYNYLRINAMFLLHKSRRKERRQLRSLDRIVEGAVGIGGGEEEGEADDDIIDHQAAVNSNKVLFALEEED